ncbi:MAG: response regulator [Deltaproteobacteria bacterium]|uniref:histidine kinase n=1 Tax=Candidatus Zymogenus saltonus TaxID=2844893 RepID=A0A9D8PQ68_9DELT|nr:response regulator [Candidatus Zymogenus saltonus]
MEDDEGLASLIKKKLLRENFEIDIAVNGEDGLAMLERKSYDIVAIDYDIPIYNGLEVIQAMSNIENPPPAIMITGEGSEDLAVEAMKLGVGDYVVKDFNGRYIELIPTVIKRVLKQHKLAIEKKMADEALKRAKDNLELKVKERTKELNRANRDLIKELNERIETEKKLRESEKRLRFLSSQLMTAQERERKRIAQELHDSIGQYLTTIKLRVRQVYDNISDPNKVSILESLDTITTIVQDTIGEVRKIVMDLRPSILDDLGIQATIRWFCREFKITNSNIEITEEIDIEEEELLDDLKIVMYRIIQEALNNVAKHSKADHISLSLFRKTGFVVLKIEDNGIGLDIDRVMSQDDSWVHFGLAGMKERTELSGGSFSIESDKGAGTVITARWPL